MNINPVNPFIEVTLPEPWPALQRAGFHEDIVLRAKGFFLQARRLGFENQATEFLMWIGEGFLKPFSKDDFAPDPNDPDRALKINVLQSLERLSNEFGDRVSSVVWRTLAYLGTRPNPEKYASILSQKEHLPFAWYLADTVLHGLGKVYGLKLHIDSRIFQYAQVALEHNCDCGCDIHGLDSDGKIASFLKPERVQLATAALFSHLCGESLLIMGLKMPFEMGVSPEAHEVMSLSFSG